VTGQVRHDYDWLVVGAGLTGATFARALADRTTARVLVVDQRGHIGGNVYDSTTDSGVRVQRYGAHIFHTGSRTVVDFLSRFTDWYLYEHRVVADLSGGLVPVPFNFTSLELLRADRADYLKRVLIEEFPGAARIPVATLTRSANREVAELGEFIVEAIFRGYTAKQWGRPIESVDSSVLERVPVTLSHDDRYFRDAFQGIPADGYTAMVGHILDHPQITVALDVDGAAEHHRRPLTRALWTGRIDAYFGNRFGDLPYRSLRFAHVVVDSWRSQPAAVVNYPGPQTYTRVIDHSYFASHISDGTVVTYEHPDRYQPGLNEPFYPVNDEQSATLFARYAALADSSDVVFAGRLGDFKYYDMHQAVARALTLVDSVLEQRRDPRAIARAARLAG
jgi:UDP-galactopyranose mutase